MSSARWIALAGCLGLLIACSAPGGDDAAVADDSGRIPDAPMDSTDVSPDASTDTGPLPWCALPDGDGRVIELSSQGGGPVYDGFGAISSAGNDRYLFDYPEPQRTEILDLLFTPGQGASLQLLKAEIGGDGNSTDGADASHMPARGVIDCDATYQFDLLAEAVARNPHVKLAGLSWSAPGWLGGGDYWSTDAIDYLLAWLDCAAARDLAIDFMGGRNESGYDRDWFVAFRAALRERYPATGLVGADAIEPSLWDFAEALVDDPDLAASVDKVGVHYPCKDGRCFSPSEVQALGIPLWVSEGGGGDDLARDLNRQFLDGRFTAYQRWPLLTACSEQTAYGGGGGLIEAREPWSGAYTVRRTTWLMAHTSQFTDVGWSLLDRASGYLGGEPARGSYVARLAPDGVDLTLVVETTDAEADQDVTLELGHGLPQRPMRVWTSNLASGDDADLFVPACQVSPVGGKVHLTLRAHHVYTLTTLDRGGKRAVTPPPTAVFPLPYVNDLEGDAPGREPRFVATQHGAFAVGPCTGGRLGRCVLQRATEPPIAWLARVGPPFVLLGDASLTDYTVRTAFQLADAGGVTLYGRYTRQSHVLLTWHDGYELQVTASGTWAIRRTEQASSVALATGSCPPIEPGTWHTLQFTLSGPTLTAALDGMVLGSASDDTFANGLAGFGCGDGSARSGWSANQFDDLAIEAAP